MKRIIYAIAGVLALSMCLSSCSMFKYDVLDGPNAQINGCLLDIVTGEKIGVETSNATNSPGYLVVVEQGWDSQAEQGWMVRFDGMYTNNLIFAADYTFSAKYLPCYEPEKNTFTVKKGKNRMNISLLPFCRILNPEIKYQGGKIVATFSVELSDPSKANTIANVALCGNTQLFVGCNYQNLAKDDAGAKAKNVNVGETITLEIDPELAANVNSGLFGRNSVTGKPYVQDRYFRIAAMANGNGYNTNNYYNFSPIFKVSGDYSKIEIVEWDENNW